MSIMRRLISLLDKNDERLNKELDPTSASGEGPKSPGLEVKEGERHFRCRICGREETQARYCPDCLADTMVETPSPRTGRGKG
jgi:hypothetical protein